MFASSEIITGRPGREWPAHQDYAQRENQKYFLSLLPSFRLDKENYR